MTVCLKQFHLVTFFFPRLCALYCRYIVHGILEFLAISFHCLQKYQLDFIGFFLFYFSVTFEFYSILLSEWGCFCFYCLFLNSLLVMMMLLLLLLLLFGMSLRRIREFHFLCNMSVVE